MPTICQSTWIERSHSEDEKPKFLKGKNGTIIMKKNKHAQGVRCETSYKGKIES
jgi:hypothetical protein